MVEGILLGLNRVDSEYRIGVPDLTWAAGARPDKLENLRELRVPRERVAFYEVVR